MLYLPVGHGRPPLTTAVPTAIDHTAAHPTVGGVPSMDYRPYSANSHSPALPTPPSVTRPSGEPIEYPVAWSPYSSEGNQGAGGREKRDREVVGQQREPKHPDADLVTHADRGSGNHPEAAAARRGPAPVGLVKPSASCKVPGNQVTDAREPSR